MDIGREGPRYAPSRGYLEKFPKPYLLPRIYNLYFRLPLLGETAFHVIGGRNHVTLTPLRSRLVDLLIGFALVSTANYLGGEDDVQSRINPVHPSRRNGRLLRVANRRRT